MRESRTEGVSNMKILIVEDQTRLGQFLEKGLTECAYTVSWVRTCQAALDALAESTYDVILLDLGLPDGDGLDLLHQWRKNGFNEPVLILSARDTVESRIKGLDLGADDYLPKPFEPRELLARIHTILRRARASAPNPRRLDFDGLPIDLDRRQVQCGEHPVELTRTEFELLARLAGKPQKVFSRDEILNRLRGHEADLYTRAVDILVSRLCRKLEPLDCIKALRNVGATFAGARR